ncbi:transmembrane protein 183-like [Choristoneura fumiferana]|uniref:transmembrane protein 183-like n=1 Tax=Choristoneura fumiferana TaxID=7141 RepID=UPI003D15B5C1
MPKKKGPRKVTDSDFTINDSANAPKPVSRLKKSTSSTSTVPTELSWDEIDTDTDIIEEVDEDGAKKFVSKKQSSKAEQDLENRPGVLYPEIIFYLISKYIKPEQISSFSGINRACYACTKREMFWRNLYKKYCQNHPRLPERLKIENSFKVYGLRQRVIRALFHTYKVFDLRIQRDAAQDSEPHRLVGRRCVNVWFCKGPVHCMVYFKLKKLTPQRPYVDAGNMIDELGRIDANPEEDCQTLQISCLSVHEVPPLMGMTLTKLSVVLSQGFRYRRVHLGFSTSSHNMSRGILPEKSMVIDSVVNIHVFDWWHPRYPPFDNKLPSHLRDEESLPVLKKDFFNIREGEL